MRSAINKKMRRGEIDQALRCDGKMSATNCLLSGAQSASIVRAQLANETPKTLKNGPGAHRPDLRYSGAP